MLRQQNRDPDLRQIRERQEIRSELDKAKAAFWLGWGRCARLFSALPRDCASAGAWNFGLCATRSREPRQARKGATVPGSPRVPQTTRSSSRSKLLTTVKRENRE